jgi:hypothetical protein
MQAVDDACAAESCAELAWQAAAGQVRGMFCRDAAQRRSAAAAMAARVAGDGASAVLAGSSGAWGGGLKGEVRTLP